METRPFRSRRQFLTLLGAGAAAVGLAGCAVPGADTATSGTQVKRLRYQGWAGQVMPPELAEHLGYLGEVTLDWVGDTTSGPQDIQSAATGQVDFGGAFNGAVVKLAAAHAPIKALISYYGTDHLTSNGFWVLNGSAIRSPRDLIGKKVAMNTLGAHNEAVLDIYLQRNGLSAAEIAQVEPVALPPANIEQALRQRQIDVAVLGGIFQDRAAATGGIRLLFSDYQQLGAFSAGTYVMTERFLQQNPGTATTFVTGVAKAIEWTRATPRDQVIATMTQIMQARGRNESTTSLKFWKSYGVAETAGRITGPEFQLWVDWLAGRGAIHKGAVDINSLYTNAFNHYTAQSTPATAGVSPSADRSASAAPTGG